MLNEPGKLLVRAAMWTSAALLGVCFLVEVLLTELVDHDQDAASAVTVLRAVVLVVHPLLGIAFAFFLLSTLIWPRRRVPGPVAHLDDHPRGE